MSTSLSLTETKPTSVPNLPDQKLDVQLSIDWDVNKSASSSSSRGMYSDSVYANDLFQPKMVTFSTRALIGVHFKTVH